jgi:hypothetical protein
MPRVTLYVPDDLKARMDDVGEAENWSAIAQAAFRKAVATHFVRRNPTDMKEVIERLRASKERVEQRSRESGIECGKTWARQSAEYDELKRIAEWTTMEGVEVPYTLDALTGLIDPEREMDRYSWHDFWEKHGAGSVDDAFAEGFIEGAAEIFDEIADEL